MVRVGAWAGANDGVPVAMAWPPWAAARGAPITMTEARTADVVTRVWLNVSGTTSIVFTPEMMFTPQKKAYLR